MLPFSRVLYVEQDDFRENPPKGWFRLGPGREVRLKHAYYITCQDVVKDRDGNVIELRCTTMRSLEAGGHPTGAK